MNHQRLIEILQELERTARSLAHGHVKTIAHGELENSDVTVLRCGGMALKGLADDLLKELE